MAVRRLASLVLAATLVLTVIPVGVADAFWADFFAKDTSGQAVYEDMAIRPQAVHLDGVTYVVYQGWLNDPYIAAYDHAARRWDGPYRVGENELKDSARPLNTHGAPALYVDNIGKRLHVFWGGHQTNIYVASTSSLSEDGRPAIGEGEWSVRVRATGGATYPQVVSYETTQGPRVELFYRVSVASGQPGHFGWASRTVLPDRVHDMLKVSPRPVIEGSAGQVDGRGWYATVEAEPNGRIHVAAISQRQDGSSSPYDREEVYYFRREPGETGWRDITGRSIGTTDTPTPSRDTMLGTPALVYQKTGESQNQVSVAVDAEGRPGLIFLTGKKYATGPDSHTWMFARWDEEANAGSGGWKHTPIAKTDHFMDSGALDFPELEDPQRIEAFLTVDGTMGSATKDRRYVDRGGDIWRYLSTDGGSTWERVSIRQSDPARGEIFNDPQIVRAAAPGDPSFRGEARLLFCQWDNDADNFINKVFLWGESGVFAQNEFLPELHRLWGATRVETAVKVSSEAFPLGPPATPIASPNAKRSVFVTTGENFADALAGVPLAYASRAPMLFVTGKTLSPAVAAELTRLKGSDTRGLDVVILGGTAAVPSSIETALRNHRDTRTVRRIDGRDRYEVSRKIAFELAQLTGVPEGVFVASGEGFPDALAAAPVAAAKGYPILLTNSDRLNDHSKAVMSSFRPKTAIVVGGPNAIDPSVVEKINTSIPGAALRVHGSDRYETAAAVATMGLNGVYRDLGVVSMDRFVVASGEQFPDALAGGVFAARLSGPVLLTRQTALPDPTRGFLADNAVEVLDAYVVGGNMAVSSFAYQQVGAILQSNQDMQREEW